MDDKVGEVGGDEEVGRDGLDAELEEERDENRVNVKLGRRRRARLRDRNDSIGETT